MKLKLHILQLGCKKNANSKLTRKKATGSNLTLIHNLHRNVYFFHEMINKLFCNPLGIAVAMLIFLTNTIILERSCINNAI